MCREQCRCLFTKAFIVAAEQSDIDIVVPRNKSSILDRSQCAAAHQKVLQMQPVTYLRKGLKHLEYFLLDRIHFLISSSLH